MLESLTIKARDLKAVLEQCSDDDLVLIDTDSVVEIPT